MSMRIVAGSLILVASASCSKSPSAPTIPTAAVPASAAFEGVWTIKYKLETCTGYRHCIDFIGDTRTIYLHLAAVGEGYDGVVDLGDHISVYGTVAADGTLKLTGRRPAAAGDDDEIEIDALTLSKSMTGAIRFTTRGPSNSSFSGNGVNSGSFTSVERTAPLNNWPSFSGTWTGSIAVGSCEATGWTHCYPLWDDTTYSVALTLNPGSSGVEGILTLGGSAIPVAGNSSGTALRLSGTTPKLSSGVDVTYAVEAEGLVSDRVGRLTGSVRLISTYEWHDGRGIWTVSYPPLPLYATARSLR